MQWPEILKSRSAHLWLNNEALQPGHLIGILFFFYIFSAEGLRTQTIPAGGVHFLVSSHKVFLPKKLCVSKTTSCPWKNKCSCFFLYIFFYYQNPYSISVATLFDWLEWKAAGLNPSWEQHTAQNSRHCVDSPPPSGSHFNMDHFAPWCREIAVSSWPIKQIVWGGNNALRRGTVLLCTEDQTAWCINSSIAFLNVRIEKVNTLLFTFLCVYKTGTLE